MSKTKVLFICLGNICRSTMAEGLFAYKIEQLRLQDVISCDSAGLHSHHQGDEPDWRTQQVLKHNGIKNYTHKAHKVTTQDITSSKYILVAEDYMKQNLLSMFPDLSNEINSKTYSMRHFDTPDKEDMNLPDPYYGDILDFLEVYEVLNICLSSFIEYLLKQKASTKTH